MAKKKICLDAGHYGKYNHSPVVKEYYESDMTWKLHLLLKKHLEAYGFEVITTRATQAKDKSLYSRGTTSKGCDLFLSIHSNATGGNKGNDSIDYPIVYVPLNGKGNVIGRKLADCIAATMETQQKGRTSYRKGSSGGEYYGVIRGAVAVGTVGLLVEHSFHTCTRAAKWLMVEANLDKLAAAEAKVIAEYFGVSAADKQPVQTNTLPYVVRITDDELNVRKGPGMKYGIVTTVKRGEAFTVVDVEYNGSTPWGKLKSGAGWISLKYTEKV